MSFAETLKTTRELRGLSQEDLGQRIGYSGRQVRRWEDGLNEPRVSLLVKLAAALEVTPMMLIRGTEDSGVESNGVEAGATDRGSAR